jgi:hypothetical protein
MIYCNTQSYHQAKFMINHPFEEADEDEDEDEDDKHMSCICVHVRVRVCC